MDTKPEDFDIDVVLDDIERAKTGDVDVQAATPAADTPKPAIVTPEEGVETLRAQLAEEKAGREAANARAAAAERDVAAARSDAAGHANVAQDANVALVSNAIEGVRQNIDVHKRNYADAMTAGDYAAAADAQAEMSVQSANLVQLQTGLQALKNAPKAVAPQIVDHVEGFAQQIAAQGAPRSAAWVRAHPEYVNNPRLFDQMQAASNFAIAKGITPDTDSYFDFVERMLDIKADRQVDSRQSAAPVDVPLPGEAPLSDAGTAVQSRSPPAAPVTRGVNGSGSRPTTVRLSAEQREVADMLGMSYTEYATNLLALKAEGQIH